MLLPPAGAAVVAPLVGAAPAEAKITMLPVSSLTIGQRTDIIKELQVGSRRRWHGLPAAGWLLLLLLLLLLLPLLPPVLRCWLPTDGSTMGCRQLLVD